MRAKEIFEKIIVETKVISESKRSKTSMKRIKMVECWNRNWNFIISLTKDKKERCIYQAIRGMVSISIANDLSPVELQNFIELLQYLIMNEASEFEFDKSYAIALSY